MEKYIKIVGIVLVLVLLNLAALKVNTGQVYEARELPSALCKGNEERAINDGTVSGNLTFGPYIEQEKGIVRITVKYETDSENNWIDVYSDKKKITFYKVNLDPNKTKVTFDVEITEDVEDLEVRSFYERGYLKIDEIIMMDRIENLRIIVGIYSCCCIVIGITKLTIIFQNFK